MARILLRPLGVEMSTEPGSALADALAGQGVEFPCGGRGRCRGCRIRVVEGLLPETDADRERLTPAERADGWRLACQAKVAGDLVIELRQWSGLILADETPFTFEPAEGLGVAIDVGTTTMVAQLMDLSTGRVLGTQTALNPQSRHGADVMSRMTVALKPEGLRTLTAVIRQQLALMVAALMEQVPAGKNLKRAAVVGNTVMHHLLLGHDVKPLAFYPFLPEHPEGAWLNGPDLGWPASAREARIHVLPNLGSFVGSDILGVILATRIHESSDRVGAADLGTNGEIVFGNKDGILVASTAAGPAFEGARISQGMRASPGAIDRVSRDGNAVSVHVIGGGSASGICGSGLVDAVACGLDLGVIAPSGRMSGGDWTLRAPVVIQQKDVRELQLAKGAIASGIRILAEKLDLPLDRVGKFFLAGAFGNNLSVKNGRRIGLLPFREEAIEPVGNAALLGAKIALFMPDMGEGLFKTLLPKVRHMPLEQHPEFQDMFAEEMAFPEKET
jgi:uncharacterized 2Fe-2S/4Fe-4S cluster protein (DUF4445 family)